MQIGQTIIDDVSQDFNEDTNISDINVSFHTLDNIPATVCVEYERVFGQEVQSVITYCTTASEGFIIGPPTSLNRDFNHRVRVYQIIDGVEYQIASYYYPSVNSALKILENLILIDYLVMALVLGIIIVAFWTKNITWVWFAFAIMSWILAGKGLITARGSFIVTMICIFAFPISRKQKELT